MTWIKFIINFKIQLKWSSKFKQ